MRIREVPTGCMRLQTETRGTQRRPVRDNAAARGKENLFSHTSRTCAIEDDTVEKLNCRVNSINMESTSRTEHPPRMSPSMSILFAGVHVIIVAAVSRPNSNAPTPRTEGDTPNKNHLRSTNLVWKGSRPVERMRLALQPSNRSFQDIHCLANVDQWVLESVTCNKMLLVTPSLVSTSVRFLPRFSILVSSSAMKHAHH